MAMYVSNKLKMKTNGWTFVSKESDFILYSPNSWSFALATREQLSTGPERDYCPAEFLKCKQGMSPKLRVSKSFYK